MKIEQLRYLLNLAENGSITKTAEHFYISQQGLSYSIKQLEKELDTKIIQYDKSTSFTPAGKLLLEKAQEIVDSHDQLQEELVGLRRQAAAETDSPKTTVKLSVTSPISSTFFMEIIEKINAASNEILLIVDEQRRSELLQKFAGPSVENEIALVSLIDANLTDCFKREIDFTLLHSCDALILASMQGPLAARAKITAEEAARYPLMFFTNEPINGIYRGFFDEAHPDTILQSTNMEIYRETIRNNAAIGCISELEEPFFAADGLCAITFQDPPRIHYGIIRPNTKPLSPEAQKVISIIENVVFSHAERNEAVKQQKK
ncbi:MAG: LysR family transcriptional regulator [Raoultibacter sp.]